ncbi:RagB/SusD family nutrient uptake outer membrane protein [Bacteroides sp.]|uniref:RagB/SusD family nutrient uptake outer membrane protein n=1 Tax=Bacteroides sp. TaxID=29523 RepID=UPI0026175215|nr:RagB/SusD family nutrient uptake outer membrane protein [Bacteroides sp.]
MKIIKTLYLGLGLIAGSTLSSCNDLNLIPLSETSTGNWYASETELEMAANEFYKIGYWQEVWNILEQSTDNFTYRNTNRYTILDGTLSSSGGDGGWFCQTQWEKNYKLIAMANMLLEKSERALNAGVSADVVEKYRAEAKFARACGYGTLITFFGDVPYLDKNLTIDEALKLGRRSKEEIIPLIYQDFGDAAAILPASYGNNAKRFTKGAVYGMKARFSMYLNDYETALEAAKNCMDLKVYELHSDFAEYFLATTKDSKESVFCFPRSIENNTILDGWIINNQTSRNSGGYGSASPSWDLLASFLCTDGKPIDESPLFDSKNPFKNRDPRCTATIVEFDTPHLGFNFTPHPDSLKVWNYKTGKLQQNNDSRAVAQYASFNGLLWKKGIDATWLANSKKVENDFVLLRYADVMLMYAEAKIELNQIDQSVLDCINAVRARAYGVDKTKVDMYPAVTTTNQDELRRILRTERRMEFANEGGVRYMDLVRWRLAEKVLNSFNYGILYPATDLRDKVTSKGLWFWPMTPKIDKDGCADFSEMVTAGLITPLSERHWPERQYLWPIPEVDILVNPNMKQNPGY